MSERYWITGVQIGMLKAAMIFTNNECFTKQIFGEIEVNQFVGNMQEPYKDYEIIIKKKRE